jgi:hypothetical protein
MAGQCFRADKIPRTYLTWIQVSIGDMLFEGAGSLKRPVTYVTSEGHGVV